MMENEIFTTTASFVLAHVGFLSASAYITYRLMRRDAARQRFVAPSNYARERVQVRRRIL